MNIGSILSSTRITSIDRPERQRAPMDEAARVERIVLVTVGLVAGLEIGLVVLWLLA